MLHDKLLHLLTFLYHVSFIHSTKIMRTIENQIMTVSSLTQVSTAAWQAGWWTGTAGWRRGWCHRSKRNKEKKKKQEGLQRGQPRKDPRETSSWRRERSVLSATAWHRFFFFFAEQKHKYLTTPARLPFSSHQYSHYSTRAVLVWQEATALMHYGQINSEWWGRCGPCMCHKHRFNRKRGQEKIDTTGSSEVALPHDWRLHWGHRWDHNHKAVLETFPAQPEQNYTTKE